MKSVRFFLALVMILPSLALSEDEASVIALFEQAGARVTKDQNGHAVKLFSGGNPPHPVADLQKLAVLKHLEEIALNAPQAGNEDWGFLEELPNLRKLTIWHCKTIRSLKPFTGLKIEGLTVGGSMGIRDLNKDTPEDQFNVVLTLQDLPNLTYLNLYHCPTVPTDAHLAHIVEHFPKLEELKLDFAAPRGFETAITPEGLGQLKKLPLRKLHLEHLETFTPDHMKVIAEIEPLEGVVLDARKSQSDPTELAAVLQTARPELEVVVGKPGDKAPPQLGRKK